MTEPDIINECDYVKAYVNEEAFNTLVEKVKRNIFVIKECRCDPPCRMLFEQEKVDLSVKVNAEVERLTIKEKMEAGMSLEDLCGFVAKYMKEKHNTDCTAQQIFNLSLTHDMSYYLDMYEEAIFHIGKDFFGQSAIVYFEDRLKATLIDEKLKPLSARYQNMIALLEKK